MLQLQKCRDTIIIACQVKCCNTTETPKIGPSIRGHENAFMSKNYYLRPCTSNFLLMILLVPHKNIHHSPTRRIRTKIRNCKLIVWHSIYSRNCFPVYVFPYSQSLGTTLKLVSVLPSLELSSKDRGWPLMSQLMCHTWPQLRPIESHPDSVPLIFTDLTSPAPPTLLISTVKKKCRPLTENLTPPSRRHLTLQVSKDTC